MRVALDLTPLLEHRTGVDVYMIQLAKNLAKLMGPHSLTVLANFEDRNALEHELDGSCRVTALATRARPVRFIAQQAVVPLMLSFNATDILHSPSFFMPLGRGRAKHILTIHDLGSFTVPQYHIRLRRSSPYRALMAASIRKADLICVPSRATGHELCQHFPDVKPDRIRVIPYGIGSEFHTVPEEEVSETRTRLNLPWPYILFVGTLGVRKNVERLIESYLKLIENGDVAEHLVLVGLKESSSHVLLGKLESAACRERVHFLGYVPSEDLPSVYRAARIFVYPSLHEGFGLPMFEALACGIPVVVSDIPPCVENLAGVAEMVCPTDVDALTEAMRRLIFDRELYSRRREQGLERAKQFSWHQTASDTLRCYQELIESSQKA